MSVIPERWCDELEDEPPDDERADERRAVARERAEQRFAGGVPVDRADFLPWLER